MENRAAEIDRRQQTLWSVFYGGIYPRRKINRRPEDDQRFIVDWHDKGLFMVAIAIVVMCCLDAFFTLNILAIGGEELNYFMRVLIDSDVRSFLSVKIATTSLGVIVLVAFARFRMFGFLPIRRVLEVICTGYACLIIWELYLLVGVASQSLW